MTSEKNIGPERRAAANYRFYSEGINTFLEVVDNEGMGKAARLLGINQSAVSQQISRLEEALGRKLFRRSTSGVTLTADGESFLVYARSMAGLTDEVRQRFSQDDGKGLLIVGMNEMFGRTALPSILWLLTKTLPNLKLRAVCGSPEAMMARFNAGEFDVLVTTAFETPPKYEAFWTERLVWIGREGNRLPVPDPVPLVLPEQPSLLRDAIFATLRKQNRTWIVAFETSNVSVGEAAVSAGFGYCAVPFSMPLRGPVHLDATCGLPEMPDAKFAVLRHPKRTGSTTVAFCKVLAEAAQAAIREGKPFDLDYQGEHERATSHRPVLSD